MLQSYTGGESHWCFSRLVRCAASGQRWPPPHTQQPLWIRVDWSLRLANSKLHNPSLVLEAQWDWARRKTHQSRGSNGPTDCIFPSRTGWDQPPARRADCQEPSQGFPVLTVRGRWPTGGSSGPWRRRGYGRRPQVPFVDAIHREREELARLLCITSQQACHRLMRQLRVAEVLSVKRGGSLARENRSLQPQRRRHHLQPVFQEQFKPALRLSRWTETPQQLTQRHREGTNYCPDNLHNYNVFPMHAQYKNCKLLWTCCLLSAEVICE